MQPLELSQPAVWLWAAHFPCFLLHFIKSDLNLRATARDGAAERSLRVPCVFSFQHHRLAAPAAPPAHAQLQLRDRQAPLPALRPAPAAGGAGVRQQLSACPLTAGPGPPPCRRRCQLCSPLPAAHPRALLTSAAHAEKPEKPQEGLWPHPTAPATPLPGGPDTSRAVQSGSVRTLELYCTRVTSSFL